MVSLVETFRSISNTQRAGVSNAPFRASAARFGFRCMSLCAVATFAPEFSWSSLLYRVHASSVREKKLLCVGRQNQETYSNSIVGFACLQILSREEGSESGGQPKKRNKKNRYGMPKISGRRFRVERMNIFGVRSTTEFSIDEVREISCELFRCFMAPGGAVLIC